MAANDTIITHAQTIKKMAAGAFMDEEDRAYLWKLAHAIEIERETQLDDAAFLQDCQRIIDAGEEVMEYPA